MQIEPSTQCRRASLVLCLLLWTTTCINGLTSTAVARVEKQKNHLADELQTAHVRQVNELVSAALGDQSGSQKLDRYAGARALADSLQVQSTTRVTRDSQKIIPSNELVYGELSIPVLATILDAVGVKTGEKFLDIGSGDGALVLGACILYPNHLIKSRGVELIPGLVERSNNHLNNLRGMLKESKTDDLALDLSARVQFAFGNVYEADQELSNTLQDTTLAVCFATTWSQMNNQEVDSTTSTSLDRRRLPKLSAALTQLPVGARVVIVDGRLDENDGFQWEGDLRVYCPDTAPYSVASLYKRC